jgi:hypothetical protein
VVPGEEKIFRAPSSRELGAARLAKRSAHPAPKASGAAMEMMTVARASMRLVLNILLILEAVFLSSSLQYRRGGTLNGSLNRPSWEPYRRRSPAVMGPGS